MTSEPTPARKSFSLLRRWGIGLNVVVSAVALLAIIVMGNYLAHRHYARWHWGDNARDQVSPLTRQFLRSLTNEVRVTVLFDPEESTLYPDVRSLLLEYQHLCPRLRLEFVNFNRPGRANALAEQYGLGGATDTLLVVFEVAGRPPRVVRERELPEYDLATALQGQPLRRTGFKGESAFTAALLSLAESRPLVAGYLTGHGEPDFEREDLPNGYQRFARLLAEKNIQLRPVSLRAEGVPRDCEVLVIAEPRTLLPVEELDRIDQYLRTGGRALILVPSPERLDVRRSGLDRLLANWGIEVGEDQVIDRSAAASGDPRILYADQFGAHPVVAPLAGSRIALYMPCSVRLRSSNGRTGDTGRGEELIRTSDQGISVHRTRGAVAGAPTNGVISLAVALERGAISGVTPDGGATRLVVVGESTFLGNTLIREAGNQDFAGLAVNWLLERPALLAISPRPVTEYRLALTRRQMRGATWMLLAVMPGGMLLLGGLVWLRRRK